MQGQPRRAPQNDPRMNGQRPPQRPQNYGRQMGAQQFSDPVRRKANREEMLADKRRRRQESMGGFFRGFAMYGIIFVVLCAICAAIFFGFFYSTPDDNKATVTYFEKFDGKYTEKIKVSEKVAYPNGVLFVNFSNIADACDMSVISDSDSAKFVFYDNSSADADGTGREEYIIINKNSTECVVCGQDARLSAPAVFSDKDVWVPADFITGYVNGITVTEEKDKGKVYVERGSKGEGDDMTLDEVSFVLKATTPPDPAEPDEDTPTTGGMPEVTFTKDLSEYEQYMNPEDASAYLKLVNKTTTVDASYVPDLLTNISNTRKDGRATQKMQMAAAKALDAMFIEMKAAGFTDITVTSAYRSYEYQEELYTKYTNREMANTPALSKEQAQAIVDTYSAKPGTSEHQSGLCADLHNLPEADKVFANEPAYDWLRENAWKFGFILRFPEDKTDVTGYDFEPWHYRFVGRQAAWIIHNGGLCLEEYLAR